ncbi:protein NRT1/ PTR FAMILY 2.7-like [Tasmannia lanceolata]|uniref:protein NRT1/ PTR FAMILY 2.7-like n=1 Tax=Tasmannia lanceolata TaxID=3420 RepID=UPI00406340D1
MASPESQQSRGGWITFPFIIGSTTGLTLAAGSINGNLVVYLIQKFNVKSIDAAQISNIINGCTFLAPIIGAIISDAYFGCFHVISVSTFISMLGAILLTLTATISSLRPPSCADASKMCEAPGTSQFTVLYSALALVAIGIGGTRSNSVFMGAYQFEKSKDRDIFFNWFYFTTYASTIASSTGIVYVEDKVSWGWGFGLCAAANAVGLTIFVLGKRYYLHLKPKGSPFTGLLQVIIAAIRKRKMVVSYESQDYYYGQNEEAKLQSLTLILTPSFRFLNRAATKTEGDTHLDGSIAKPWRLCTVEQVANLKTLIRILPLWSTGILLSTPIGIQSNLTILQALSMDRHLGRSHFSIPAGSMIVFVFIATAVSLSIVDRFLIPTWRNLTGQHPTPLQRVGLGHVLNIVSMAVSALVESRRTHIGRSHHLEDHSGLVVPMSALWLVPQLALVGAGEAFHYPGQVALYYQEFPVKLRSTGTGMIALLVGIGFYLSTAVIDLVRRVTGWLPDNINQSRLDNVYWMLAVVGVFNLGYYILCARFYQYQKVQKPVMDVES